METLFLGLIGLCAGALGGLLGVGGSIVMIPALTELFGPQQHLYQAAAMIVNFFVVLPAAYRHYRAGAMMTAVVKHMVPLAIVAVMLGVLASEWSIFRGSGQARLTMLFGLFLIYTAARMLAQIPRSGLITSQGGKGFDARRDGLKAGLVAGLPTGFIAGLLGVGGGTICVPFQNRYLRIPLRSAIANSTATIVMLSLIGASSKNWALAMEHPADLRRSLGLAGMLIPTAILGGWLGSRWTHVLPLKALRVVFSILLVIGGGRMIWHGYLALNPPADARSAHFVPAPSASVPA